MPVEDYAGFAWLRQNWEQLGAFNFHWVAVNGNGLIDHNRDLAPLMALVIGREAQRTAVYAFVDMPQVAEP